MEEVNLKLLKDELDMKLHSYRTNQFSKDILDYFSKARINNTLQSSHNFDSILSAKNEWEACVDCLEHQAMVVLDHDLNVIRVNRTIELWGWGEVDKVSGIHILNLIEPATENNSSNDWCQLDLQTNAEWESSKLSTNKKFRFSFYPNRDIDSMHHNDDCYAVLLISDITEKVKQKTKNYVCYDKMDSNTIDGQTNLVEKSEKRIQQLAEQLINTQESERKRISSELHDGIGQMLSALKFQVESVVSESIKSSQQRKNDTVLFDVLDNIKIALSDLRRISVDLRPSSIDDFGLLIALRLFVDQYNKVYTSLSVDLQLDVYESSIPDNNKDVIYRIIQEAMNNIAKHAYATKISLQLLQSDIGLLLRISDNGVGFDVDKIEKDKKSGLGLKSMRERAVSSGAKFTMSSNSSLGTIVQLFWKVD